MTFTTEAIRELQESKTVEQSNAAILRALADSNDAVVALPDRYSTHDLEKLALMRRRARGCMTTTSIPDFAAYSQAHREFGATVFINAAKMRAVALLNLGAPKLPGHADNQAVLELEQTAAYKAMRFACSGHKSQSALAEFLEDWPDAVDALAHGEDLSMPKAISAIRKISIEALRRIESEEQQLSTTRSAFESVAATSVEKLPTHIEFNCVPFAGLTSRQFVLRMSVHTGEKSPLLSLRLINEEKHAEEMAQELCALLRQEISGQAGEEAMPVLIGSYAASA